LNFKQLEVEISLISKSIKTLSMNPSMNLNKKSQLPISKINQFLNGVFFLVFGDDDGTF